MKLKRETNPPCGEGELATCEILIITDGEHLLTPLLSRSPPPVRHGMRGRQRPDPDGVRTVRHSLRHLLPHRRRARKIDCNKISFESLLDSGPY